ncbi:hypothetical protein [Nocardia stercoris]|uniref:Uncharacterized protein n=1 Tax=Nocardia stercoris TaxID=2483361 RepID=A0A3M2KVM2_9NOCA|nr:hypothetical protein [Nocardia stercoris]RMI29519.1 hypothetical protein EBN03_25970 [Nocardia stercoris]
MNLSLYVGRPVVLCGLAENAKSGAILVCGPRSHVYVEGVRRWPDEHVHRAFEVRGVLDEVGDDAAPSAQGERRHRQGVRRYFIVRDVTVDLVPRPSEGR